MTIVTPPLRNRRSLLAIACTLALSTTAGRNALAATDGGQGRPIADLSIEELMNVEVVSVSKKSQRLSDSAAAVFVISADDIHRSGVTNLPEALRLAPGVAVGWIGGGAYSVSIRGFGGRFANKLLVLQDGRSLYTSFFAGVFWERELPMLEDIERIEVIRGPGAAVWGANAVNGVINIITRSSRQTVGGLATASAGGDQYHAGAVRYGVQIDDHSTLRLFGRGSEDQAGTDLSGASAPDAVRNLRTGLRYDRDDGPTRISMQSEVYRMYSGQKIEAPTPEPPYVTDASNSQHLDGGYALARLERTLADSGSLSVQSYYDHSRVELGAFVDESRDVLDLEVQHHVHLSPANDVVWGAEFKSDADAIEGSQFVQFDPARFTRYTTSLLAQDEISLLPDTLHASIGAILARDSVAGTNLMPDLRLIWNVTANSTAWAAASRALRSPSRAETDVQYLLGPTVPAAPPYVPLPVIPVATGTKSFGPERENAFQVGYRIQPTRDLSVDLTAFLSRYSDLRTDGYDPSATTPGVVDGLPYLRLPIEIMNGQTATSRGAEVSVDWRALPWWRLQGNFSNVVITSPAATDFEGITTNTPRNTASLRSQMDLGPARLDLWMEHVDTISISQATTVVIPAYFTLNARVAWNPIASVELALCGQNLVNSHHLEVVSDNIITAPRETDRNIVATVRYTF